MNDRNGLWEKARVLALLALLVFGPAAMAADPSSDTSWLDAIQEWFESLLDDDPEPTDEDGGVIHVPGG